MDEHILNGRKSTSPLSPNTLDRYFLIPAVSSEGMDEAAWDEECKRMFSQTRLAQKFVSGQITPEDFEDGLLTIGYDPYSLEEIWRAGDRLL